MRKALLITFLSAYTLALFAQSSSGIKSGAENLNAYLPLLSGKRVAVFANQTSMAGDIHLVDLLIKKRGSGESDFRS